jgi:hypothetical protein
MSRVGENHSIRDRPRRHRFAVLSVIIVGIDPRIVASFTPTPCVEILCRRLLELDPVVQQLFLLSQFMQKIRPKVHLLNVGDVVARLLSIRLNPLLIPDEVVGKVVRRITDFSDTGYSQCMSRSLVAGIDLKCSAIKRGVSQVSSPQNMCLIIRRFSEQPLGEKWQKQASAQWCRERSVIRIFHRIHLAAQPQHKRFLALKIPLQCTSDEQIQTDKCLLSESLLTKLAIQGIIFPSRHFIGLFGDRQACSILITRDHVFSGYAVQWRVGADVEMQTEAPSVGPLDPRC